jgi:glucose-6-phosphate isomerase
MAIDYRQRIEEEMVKGCKEACASHQHLLKHAENPVDLTKEGVLTAERIKRMALKALNLKMIYAMERVNDEVLHDLCTMAKELGVVDKMHQVQDMEIMNFVENCKSEHRRVGHTAIRRGSRKDGSKLAIEAAELYEVEMQKVRDFLPYSKQFKHIIAVGIGGSYLGTKAVYNALKSFQTEDRELDFISNVDPDKAASVLKGVVHSLCTKV